MASPSRHPQGRDRLDKGYLPDDDTRRDVCLRYDDACVDSRIGDVEQEDLGLNQHRGRL